MRSVVACVGLLVIAGAAVFTWQRNQIAGLRAQVSRQGDALEDMSLRMGLLDRFAAAPLATRASLRMRPAQAFDVRSDVRADERRIILDQYKDVLSQMDLPKETATRLEDLLTDRVETVLDAQDAAEREGFAEGSAQMARAVGLAIEQVDRDIVGLVGQQGIRQIDGLPEEQQAAPAAVPAAPVVVNVTVQAPPPAPVYAATDSSDQASAPYAAYPYTYIPYFPVGGLVNVPRGRRHFVEPGRAVERPQAQRAVLRFR
jgi:hypothetical protein